jgi:beta-N-acetylhexosaminidase
VARLAAAFIRGVQEAGVAATAKHFPGHGDTDIDSHLGLPVLGIDARRLDTLELAPFRAAIGAGVAAMMTAHIALPGITGDSVPATLSPLLSGVLLRDSLRFDGVTFTDALTMEGVARGYGVEESAVRAVLAGDDVLLMPVDVGRAIDAVVAAVRTGRIPPDRLDRSVRRILALKVRTGAADRPIVSLDSLRAVVGSAPHRATADTIAARAITLLRDRDALVPLAAESTYVVRYTADEDPSAGAAFVHELRRHHPVRRAVRVGPTTGREELARIGAEAARAPRTVVYTYTRTLEGAGRIAIAGPVAALIDSLAATRPVVVVAGGNPYVLRQFPRVSSYLVTYGRGDALERAAARALAGRAAIGGTVPVTLPGFFVRGEGLVRRPPASRETR